MNTLEELVTEIEQVLQNEMEREVSSAMIGELVMERLKRWMRWLCALCLGLPPVQGHQYLHAGAEQAAGGPQIDRAAEEARGIAPGSFGQKRSLRSALNWGSLIPLVCQFGPAAELNKTAVLKALSQKDMLHDGVFLLGVHPDGADMTGPAQRFDQINGGFGESPPLAVLRKAMRWTTA